MEKSWNYVFEFLWEPFIMVKKITLDFWDGHSGLKEVFVQLIDYFVLKILFQKRPPGYCCQKNCRGVSTPPTVTGKRVSP